MTSEDLERILEESRATTPWWAEREARVLRVSTKRPHSERGQALLRLLEIAFELGRDEEGRIRDIHEAFDRGYRASRFDVLP